MAKITGINHITLSVVDINKSIAFYKDILGMQLLVQWDQGAYLLAGDLWFCLAKTNHKRKIDKDDYTHYAFHVEPEQFASLVTTIKQSGTTIFKENNSPGNSLYFLDPDGHQLEIHTGNAFSRLKAKKSNPGSWQNTQWHV